MFGVIQLFQLYDVVPADNAEHLFIGQPEHLIRSHQPPFPVSFRLAILWDDLDDCHGFPDRHGGFYLNADVSAAG